MYNKIVTNTKRQREQLKSVQGYWHIFFPLYEYLHLRTINKNKQEKRESMILTYYKFTVVRLCKNQLLEYYFNYKVMNRVSTSSMNIMFSIK